MKTSVEIPDSLLSRATRIAEAQNTSVDTLIVEGLRRVVESSSARTSAKIKPVVHGGTGLSPEFRDANWSQIRAAGYGYDEP